MTATINMNYDESQVNSQDMAVLSQYVASAAIIAATQATAVGAVVVASQAELAAQALTLQSLALMSIIIEQSAESAKTKLGSEPKTQTAAAPALSSSVPWPSGNIAPPKDLADAIKRIREYLAILRVDGSSWTVISNLTQFLTMCYEKFPAGSADRATFEKQVNGMAIISGFKSIGSLIIDSLTGSVFYSSKGDFKADTINFLKELIGRLEAAGVTTSGNGMASDILKNAKDRLANITSWWQNRIKPDGSRNQTFDQFWNVQGGINDYFFAMSNVSQWRNLFIKQMIDDIVKKFKNNPEIILAYLLTTVFGIIGDENGIQMGAYSNAVNKLTQGSNTMAELMNIFKSGKFTPSSVKDFFQKMADQKAITDADKRKQGNIAPQVDSAFDAFYNATVQWQVGTQKDPITGKDVPIYQTSTVKDLLAKGDYAHLAEGMNNLGPNAKDPSKDISQWKGLVDGLDGASKAFTNESSSTGVKLNQATNDDNTFTATRQSMLKSIIDFINAIIQAFRRG